MQMKNLTTENLNLREWALKILPSLCNAASAKFACFHCPLWPFGSSCNSSSTRTTSRFGLGPLWLGSWVGQGIIIFFLPYYAHCGGALPWDMQLLPLVQQSRDSNRALGYYIVQYRIEKERKFSEIGELFPSLSPSNPIP